MFLFLTPFSSFYPPGLLVAAILIILGLAGWGIGHLLAGPSNRIAQFDLRFAAVGVENLGISTRLISALDRDLQILSHQTRLKLCPLRRHFPTDKKSWNHFLKHAPETHRQLLRPDQADLMLWAKKEEPGDISFYFLQGEGEDILYDPANFGPHRLIFPASIELRRQSLVTTSVAVAHLWPQARISRRSLMGPLTFASRRLALHLDDLSSELPEETAFILHQLSAWLQFRLGDEMQDIDALERSRVAYKALLESWPLTQSSNELGQAWSNLASLNATLGLRQSGVETLEQAVDAADQALQIFTHGSDPLRCAALQNLRARVLTRLGQRQNDPSRLEQGLTALRGAEHIWKREVYQRRWYETQRDLGDVLYWLGLKLDKTQYLEQAIEAYKNALHSDHFQNDIEVLAHTTSDLTEILLKLTQRDGRLEHVTEAASFLRSLLNKQIACGHFEALVKTRSRLGTVLTLVGEQEGQIELLNEAVDMLRDAGLKGLHEDIAAYTENQRNLARALAALGEEKQEPAFFRQAVLVTRRLLNVSEMQNFCKMQVVLKGELASLLFRLGRLKRSGRILSAAAKAFENTLLHLDPDDTPADWARTQQSLAECLIAYAKLFKGSSDAQIEKAMNAYRRALMVVKRERAPRHWAEVQNGLGVALSLLGQRGGGRQRLEQALKAYTKALDERPIELAPFERAETLNNLGKVLVELSGHDKSKKHLEKAVNAFTQAHDIVKINGLEGFALKVWTNLTQAEKAIANHAKFS